MGKIGITKNILRWSIEYVGAKYRLPPLSSLCTLKV